MSCGHLTAMVRWVLALGALLAAAGPARARPPRCPTHEPPRCVLLGYSASQNEYTYTVDGESAIKYNTAPYLLNSLHISLKLAHVSSFTVIINLKTNDFKCFIT